jgi:hypothetical protein
MSMYPLFLVDCLSLSHGLKNFGLGLCCLTPLSTIFQLCRGGEILGEF